MEDENEKQVRRSGGRHGHSCLSVAPTPPNTPPNPPPSCAVSQFDTLLSARFRTFTSRTFITVSNTLSHDGFDSRNSF